MANVAISGDTSGAVTLTVPSTVGTQTATFPAATGTVMVSGNMPAFSATMTGSNTTIANATWIKLAFNNKVFDTANCYDPTTNYRFTPNVAGYYSVTVMVNGVSAAISLGSVTLGGIYKNGTNFQYGLGVNTVSGGAPIMTTTIYLNGSTDYIEAYAFQNSGSSGTIYTGIGSQFTAYLVRTA